MDEIFKYVLIDEYLDYDINNDEDVVMVDNYNFLKLLKIYIFFVLERFN